MAACPDCDAEIDVDEFDVDRGDELSCAECGSNLEVVAVAPVELQAASDDDDEDEGQDDDQAETSDVRDADDRDSEWDE